MTNNTRTRRAGVAQAEPLRSGQVAPACLPLGGPLGRLILEPNR